MLKEQIVPKGFTTIHPNESKFTNYSDVILETITFHVNYTCPGYFLYPSPFFSEITTVDRNILVYHWPSSHLSARRANDDP